MIQISKLSKLKTIMQIKNLMVLSYGFGFEI